MHLRRFYDMIYIYLLIKLEECVMERIKDFFFDLSDIVISLIIIAVIFGIVSWKLNDAMPIPISFFNPGSNSEIVESVTDVPPTTIEINITENANTPKEQISKNNPIKTTGLAQTETTTSQNSKTVSITIPSGASGDKIARILKNNGVINDTTAFLQVVSKLGLGSNLRAGTFTLNTTMTYEEVANKLAGK